MGVSGLVTPGLFCPTEAWVSVGWLHQGYSAPLRHGCLWADYTMDILPHRGMSVGGLVTPARVRMATQLATLVILVTRGVAGHTGDTSGERDAGDTGETSDERGRW